MSVDTARTGRGPREGTLTGGGSNAEDGRCAGGRRVGIESERVARDVRMRAQCGSWRRRGRGREHGVRDAPLRDDAGLGIGEADLVVCLSDGEGGGPGSHRRSLTVVEPDVELNPIDRERCRVRVIRTHRQPERRSGLDGCRPRRGEGKRDSDQRTSETHSQCILQDRARGGNPLCATRASVGSIDLHDQGRLTRYGGATRNRKRESQWPWRSCRITRVRGFETSSRLSSPIEP